MKLSLLLIALTLVSSAYAQHNPIYDWAPTDAIHLRDSVTAFRVNYKRDKGDAIAIVSPKGVEIGNDIPLPDNVQGIAAYEGHVAVFYQPGQKGENRELHVLELDPKTGATLQDKLFYSVSSPNFVAFVVERDASGRLMGVMARTTAWETKHQDGKTSSEKEMIQMGQTNGLELILPDQGLTPRVVRLPAGGEAQRKYWGSMVSDKGAFLFVSSSETQLIVQRFSATGALEGKLEASFDPESPYEDIPGLDPVVLCSLDGDALMTDVVFTRHKAKHPVSRMIRFDFTDGKVYQTPEVVVQKGFSGQAQPESRNANWHIEFFRPVDMEETPDYIIAVKELDWNDTFTDDGGGLYSTSMTGYRDMALIQVYDKKLNLLRTIPLIKSLTTNIPLVSAISVHAEGDNLYAITAENPPPHKPGLREYFYTISLRTGEVARQQVKKDDDFKTSLTIPQYVYWFHGGSCLINHIFKTTIGIPKKVRTSFNVSKYEPVQED